jgi:hypothetical protein
MTAGLRGRVIERLWPRDLRPRVNVWTILDGARDRRIFGAVDRTSQDKCCLYSGNLPWQLQLAAPYLVQLDREDSFTDYVIDNGWGNSWGIFFRSETSMRNLRNHLRTFLRVRDQSGRRLVFRYYDPRVLRLYLPTCNAKELAAVFGPIHEFVAEDERPGSLLQFEFDGRELTRTQVEWAPGK